MRVLLDECVPRQLRRDLQEFEVKTTQEAGWAGVKNGALLELAASQFDVLFTVDQGIADAHAAAANPVAVVILSAGTTDPVLLRPHIAKVRAAPQAVRPGQLFRGDA